jgi:hypothetical protein
MDIGKMEINLIKAASNSKYDIISSCWEILTSLELDLENVRVTNYDGRTITNNSDLILIPLP